ncbi:MAG TPA: NUDIX domain-containing protein [Candidatus Paceibacterota bacterium]|jgi:isopentenyldiphosphate isomerase|nr:NUDIX domain-containing protein [Candidatus Paceibacterota bacterium]
MDIFAHLKEKLDILDADGNKTGEAKTYDEVHSRGLLHLCVHGWVINSKRELLLQKRSKYVRAYPEYWDGSAFGHVNSGQTSLEAAQKETSEELGLDLPSEAFKHLFSVKENYVLNNGTFIENAFNDVYVIHADMEIKDFKTEPDEVTEIRWLGIEEFKEWVLGKGEPLVPHKEEYEKLLEYLATQE